MPPRPLPPQDFLRECFRLDVSGALYWKHRPDNHFPDPTRAAGWNTLHAGTRACHPCASSRGRSRVDLKVSFTFQGEKVRTTASRVILAIVTGEEPDHVDHINGDTLDNRPDNLRAATAQMNQCNTGGYRRRLLPKGVYYHRGQFFSQATWGRKSHFLGRYETPGDAHAAWCEWARQRHGKFFNPGRPKATIFD